MNRMNAQLAASPLRDQRIGRVLAARGGRLPLAQAEQGGSITHDNILRMAAWRNRYARMPVEATVAPIGYVPIPRYRALAVIEHSLEADQGRCHAVAADIEVAEPCAAHGSDHAANFSESEFAP